MGSDAAKVSAPSRRSGRAAEPLRAQQNDQQAEGLRRPRMPARGARHHANRTIGERPASPYGKLTAGRGQRHPALPLVDDLEVAIVEPDSHTGDGNRLPRCKVTDHSDDLSQ